MSVAVASPAPLDRAEVQRKVLHIAMGGFAFALAWLTWWQALALALIALAHNVWVLPRYARARVFRGDARTKGRDLGIVLYPASIAILILVLHTKLEIVAAAWGLLAFGDGFATLAGRSIGGPRLPWNRAKTWSGYGAFLFMGFSAAWFLYGHTLRAKAPVGSDPAVTGGTDGWSLAMIVMATLVAATLESLDLGLDDNVLVPLASAGFLLTLSLVDRALWTAQVASSREWVLRNLPWALGVNLVLAAGAYAARSVSVSGAVAGVLVGGTLFAFGGWRSFMMLVVFFVLGTAATKTGYARKAALGIAQERGGRRGAKNAVANCGVGALLAVVAGTSSYESLALLGLAAAFATAACDTVSSEIGQAYGRTTYLITTLERVKPGTDGAVSLEGTLAGIAAGAVVALTAWGLGLTNAPGAVAVVAAAIFGSTLESWMGARWERSKLIDNEAINFANTLAGALFAIAMTALLPSLGILA